MQAWPHGTATTSTGFDMQMEHSVPARPRRTSGGPPALSPPSFFPAPLSASSSSPSASSASASAASAPAAPAPASTWTPASLSESEDRPESTSPSENSTSCRSPSSGRWASPAGSAAPAARRPSRDGLQEQSILTNTPMPKISTSEMIHAEAPPEARAATSQFSPPHPPTQLHRPAMQIPCPLQSRFSHSDATLRSVKHRLQQDAGDSGYTPPPPPCARLRMKPCRAAAPVMLASPAAEPLAGAAPRWTLHPTSFSPIGRQLHGSISRTSPSCMSAAGWQHSAEPVGKYSGRFM